MPKFVVTVAETWVRTRHYVVEADSKGHARVQSHKEPLPFCQESDDVKVEEDVLNVESYIDTVTK